MKYERNSHYLAMLGWMLLHGGAIPPSGVWKLLDELGLSVVELLSMRAVDGTGLVHWRASATGATVWCVTERGKRYFETGG